MLAISWLGNMFIVLGLWYIGKKEWWAFGFSIVGETAWIAYSLSAHLWSLAFICAVFDALAIRNLVLWRREGKSA